MLTTLFPLLAFVAGFIISYIFNQRQRKADQEARLVLEKEREGFQTRVITAETRASLLESENKKIEKIQDQLSMREIDLAAAKIGRAHV